MLRATCLSRGGPIFYAAARRWREAAVLHSVYCALHGLVRAIIVRVSPTMKPLCFPSRTSSQTQRLTSLRASKTLNQGDLAYRHTLARLRNSNRQRRCGHIRHLAIAGQRAAVAQLRGQPLRSSARRRGQHSACMPTRGQRKHPQEPRKRPPRPQDTTLADGRTLVCYVSAIALVVFLVTKLALGL